MILPDVNLLLYATDQSSRYHETALAWWQSLLSSTTTVGLPHVCILGFLRLSSHPKVFSTPLKIDTALTIVQSWLQQPYVITLNPTPRHFEILKSLLTNLGVGGNLVTDAHLATLAIEHGYTLCSNDVDFTRFERLKWHNPLTKN